MSEKKSKQARKWGNISVSMAQPLNMIDRVEARHGVVLVRTKDGQESNFTPREACERALTLHRGMRENPQLPQEIRKRVTDICEQVQKAAREAMAMQHDHLPGTKTKLVTDALHNRHADGRPFKDRDVPEDIRVQGLKIQYPHMQEGEIAAVLRSQYSDKEQAVILYEMNRIRAEDEMREKAGEAGIVIPPSASFKKNS